MSTKPAKNPVPEAMARHLKEGRAERALLVERSAIDEEARTASLAFASEAPYERYWGIEILDCAAPSMRQGRLRSGANLLCDHDSRDVVGVIESVEIGADRVARAVVRFGKSARAEEVWQDVRDGIRRNVSVGYLIHKAQLIETKDGMETFRVTDWEPFEVSLVSVPADATVGVGRSLEPAGAGDMQQPAASEKETPSEPAPADPAPESTPKEEKTMTAPEVKVETPAQRNHAAEIAAAAASIPGGAELAMRSLQAGHTMEQFQAEAIKAMSNKPLPTADIGMDKREVQKYSIMRALNALANPTDAAAQRAAAFERECSDAAGTKLGKQARGFLVPFDIQQRDLTAGTANAGGYTVATDLLSGSFIDLLRNAMVISGLGTRMMTGLVGNIAIPKLTGAATHYWVAENAAPTNSQQTLGQVTMTPKTVGAFTDISRRLLLQSSISVEAMVQQDLASVLGLAIQQAAINGTGASNQPSGIMTMVTAISLGTNGLAPTHAHQIALETAVSTANADVGTLAYLTNAKVRGKLKGTEKYSAGTGQPVWADGSTPLNGYRAAVTNAVPSNLTKGSSTGVCSAELFGNFADLMIGMWGGLDLTVDPYSGSTAGTVRVVALQDVDVALRNVESFAFYADVLTA
jgi:HK97 family phage major capsid protein/HK97 family phage prohead protease